jgi:hypothetical protein
MGCDNSVIKPSGLGMKSGRKQVSWYAALSRVRVLKGGRDMFLEGTILLLIVVIHFRYPGKDYQFYHF